MNGQPSDVGGRVREIQEDIEHEVARLQRRWHYRVHEKRVRFERRAHAAHRRMKRSVLRFLRESSIPNLLTAPIIYSMIVPLLWLDLWITLYQRVCFQARATVTWPPFALPEVRRLRRCRGLPPSPSGTKNVVAGVRVDAEDDSPTSGRN